MLFHVVKCQLIILFFRPACRTKKDINSHRVIVSHDCVFLADDYDVGTVGDTFSFEIKVGTITLRFWSIY